MALLKPRARARTPVSGTSYQATGFDNIPDPAIDQELGSSQSARLQELVPELSSPYLRTVTYGKMMNHSSVDVSARVWKTPVLGADYYVDSYSEDPLDAEIAEFVSGNLFGGMSAPFSNSLEDILHMCEDGYAVLEKVHENREWTAPGKGRNTKVYTMLKKLAVRPTTSVSKINYDNNGGPVSVMHNAIQADGSVMEQELPISKTLVFTLNRKGGDLTGKSVLRTAYPHWYYLTHMYKIDAIQKERHGTGVPKGKLLPGYNEEDKKILRRVLRNLRTNEESFIMETPNIEITFAELTTQPVDVLKSAEHHNTMILLNVMAQFMALGIGATSSGGGRATAGTGADMFMKALRYIANHICEVINMYVIPELVVWNYKTVNFPQLKVRNIGETRDLQNLAAALSNLLAQQGITMDDPTEEWIRTTFDMPKKQGPRPVAVATNTPVDPAAQATAQKGDVKNGKGTGYVGKPVNAPS